MRRLLSASLLFSIPFISLGASFDCTKATTNVEMLICKDTPTSREISELDVTLNNLYSLAVKNSNNPAALKKEQINWLKQVRDKCNDVSCLEEVYTLRVLQLTNRTSDSSSPPEIIFGTFSERSKVCNRGMGDSWDCDAEVSNSITVSPGPNKTVSISIDLNFDNGHICRLDRTGRWENGVVILPLVWGGKIYTCKLGLSATDSEITITDRDSCTEQSCGARGNLSNVKLKRNR